MQLVLFIICILLVSGCNASERRSADLLDTARFEEKQNNRQHATQLYDEIVRKYPGTPAAAEASRRLDELKQNGKR